MSESDRFRYRMSQKIRKWGVLFYVIQSIVAFIIILILVTHASEYPVIPRTVISASLGLLLGISVVSVMRYGRTSTDILNKINSEAIIGIITNNNYMSYYTDLILENSSAEEVHKAIVEKFREEEDFSDDEIDLYFSTIMEYNELNKVLFALLDAATKLGFFYWGGYEYSLDERTPNTVYLRRNKEANDYPNTQVEVRRDFYNIKSLKERAEKVTTIMGLKQREKEKA